MGRPFLSDPAWVNKAEEGRSEDIQRCICCLRCMEYFQDHIMNGKPVGCAVNPRACRESEMMDAAPKNGGHRQIVIVGAGPAGLTAAKELAARDFKVTVLERQEEPGGQLLLAKMPPLKEKIAWPAETLARQALQEGAEIRYHVDATKEMINSYQPYAVILATGGEAVAPAIPGSDAENVVTVTPILMGEKKYQGKEIAVIGSGMTGLETAELLQIQGNRVTIIEMADKIAPGAYPVNADDVIGRLKKGGARFMPGRKLERISSNQLHLSRKDGVMESIATDATVLSIGVLSRNELEKEVSGCCDRLYVIGDAKKPGRIGDATRSAFEVARKIQ